MIRRPAAHASRILFVVVLAASCDDSRNMTMGPSSSTGTDSVTFTGSTRAVAPGTCTGDAHIFTAGAGNIRVTLVSRTPAETLAVEICEPSVVNRPEGCTLGRTRIEVGQTLEAARRGGTQQELTLRPLSCAGGGPASPDPITYNVSVTFPRN